MHIYILSYQQQQTCHAAKWQQTKGKKKLGLHCVEFFEKLPTGKTRTKYKIPACKSIGVLSKMTWSIGRFNERKFNEIATMRHQVFIHQSCTSTILLIARITGIVPLFQCCMTLSTKKTTIRRTKEGKGVSWLMSSNQPSSVVQSISIIILVLMLLWLQLRSPEMFLSLMPPPDW